MGTIYNLQSLKDYLSIVKLTKKKYLWLFVIIPFKTEEEVIEMANSTKYGLSASIFTENLSRGHRVARQ